jgi:phosphohistidine phosphatase
MLLYLLRHGDANQDPSFDDSERPLSELGERQAATVASFLRSGKIRISTIYSSPLLRAVQTGEVVRTALNISKLEKTEYLVPGTRKGQLLAQLNSSGMESVLLVGHEPHLSQTMSLLLSGREDLPLEFKKCSLASLIASSPVRKGHALLQWLVTYEQMQLLRH